MRVTDIADFDALAGGVFRASTSVMTTSVMTALLCPDCGGS
jgi:hypothetical protein